MCGIAGFVHKNRVFSINEINLLRMRDSLVHRGPDDGGFYSSIGVGLASRRLSIQDLSPRGHMPMRTTDGRYTIVYNGEVYNFQELRTFLEAKGHTFESETDTEVLLKLYVEEGPHMLRRLNGMFALAIWDSFERSLFLARDRMGVKPLYYTMVDEALVFASEEKALFETGAVCEFDPDSWEELLLFRYVSGQNTPFREVKRLLPGHFLLWKDGESKIRCWWNMKERILEIREERKVRRDDYLETLSDSVRLRLISDVPVGILLSGGLDSSSLAVLASLSGSKQLGGFTCRFREKGYDEGDIARLVAEYWKMDFYQRYVQESEILPLLEKACWINDEPLAHASNLHMFAISQTAKPHATVLLSGDGADETLGGYERYRPLLYPSLLGASRHVIPWLAQKVPAGARFSKLSRFLQLGEIDEFILYNTCQVLPDDLAFLGFPAVGNFPYRRLVLEESKELYTHAVRRAMYSDQKIFLNSLLDRNDRMTMGTSIECRVPFLDYRLIEIAGNLPTKSLFTNGRGKSLLRNYVKSQLPSEVIKHRKWGFGVPWHLYLRQIPELREIVADLGNLEPIQSGPFDKYRLELILTMFLQGNDTYALLVQQLFLIAVWYQICVQSRKPKARRVEEIVWQKKAVNQNYIVT